MSASCLPATWFVPSGLVVKVVQPEAQAQGQGTSGLAGGDQFLLYRTLLESSLLLARIEALGCPRLKIFNRSAVFRTILEVRSRVSRRDSPSNISL